MKFPLFNRTERRSIVGKGKKRLAEGRSSRASLSSSSVSSASSPHSPSKVAEARKRIQLGAQANALRVFKRMKNQFADANKCYRELVQNSMDAGTDKMYFEFNAHSVLMGEKIREYLKIFDVELRRAGRNPEELRAGLKQAGLKQEGLGPAGLEELLVDGNGECPLLQEILGEGYAFAQELTYKELSEYKQNSYHTLLKEQAGLRVAVKADWQANQYGFSPQVMEALDNSIDKMKYVDFMIQWNAGVKLGKIADGRNEIKKAGWGKLLKWRYRLLQEFLDEARRETEQKAEQNAEQSGTDAEQIKQQSEQQAEPVPKQDLEYLQHLQIQQLQKLAAEPCQEYASRIQYQWQKAHPWDYIPDLEKYFFNDFESEETSPLTQLLAGMPQRLEIIAEDFGQGMTHADRENFLKKIFATSKEGDREQTGRFGVGFISVFSLNPKEVIVESVKNGEAWEYHFLQETETTLPGKLYVFNGAAPRQRGTKVTIRLEKQTAEQVHELIENAYQHLRDDCKHVEKPIYVQGRPINEEFALAAPVTVRFGKKGVEGIIGLVNPAKASYRLENNRLRLEEKSQGLAEKLFPGYEKVGFAVLVSSKYLNYDIARENVERDANFNYIVRLVKGQEDNIAREVFSHLERELLGGRRLPIAESDLCYDFARTYLSNKIDEAGQRRKKKKVERLLEILPDGVLNAKMLFTVEGECWSFRQVLEYLGKSKEQVLYTGSEQNELTDLLASQGTRVFTSYFDSGSNGNGTTRSNWGPWSNYSRKELLALIAECKEVQSSYKAAKIQSNLSEEEQTFLNAFAQRLLGSPLCTRFGRVVASHFEEGTVLEQSRPFSHVYEMYRGQAYYRLGQTSEAQTRGSFFSRAWQKINWYFSGAAVADTLAINISHPYIQKIREHEQIIGDGVGHNLLLQAVCQEYYGSTMALLEQLFKEEQRRVGKAEEYLIRGRQP